MTPRLHHMEMSFSSNKLQPIGENGMNKQNEISSRTSSPYLVYIRSNSSSSSSCLMKSHWLRQLFFFCSSSSQTNQNAWQSKSPPLPRAKLTLLYNLNLWLVWTDHLVLLIILAPYLLYQLLQCSCCALKIKLLNTIIYLFFTTTSFFIDVPKPEAKGWQLVKIWSFLLPSVLKPYIYKI